MAWGRGARGGERLLLALALSSYLWLGAAAVCFEALATPPYEAFWLENQNERHTGFQCLAIRILRLSLKIMKVTFERWSVEMDYVKCVMDKLGMNAALLTPPWARASRPAQDMPVVARQSTAGDFTSFLQTWQTIISSFWKAIEFFFSRIWTRGIFVCTRSYFKYAFWRWIDGAPLLK